MAVQYVRRFRMEYCFGSAPLPAPMLPPGYRWIGWHPGLVERHAVVKYDSFLGEVDASLFPGLASVAGCYRLMHEISRQEDFLPGVTWLAAWQPDADAPAADCATIQGLRQSETHGSVQNVGVVPEHRGLGLGRALVLKALAGFRAARLNRVYLEVTAQNVRAVRLYRAMGFRLARTMFKQLDAPLTALGGPGVPRTERETAGALA
ncbi:MAG TPA: N-acetyltransferase [Planctomycetaceae bacterium]|nr:N-acetyltransferase [Planctomycetaceae bacterium]